MNASIEHTQEIKTSNQKPGPRRVNINTETQERRKKTKATYLLQKSTITQ
jgi:hypothetical protein